MGTQRRQWEGQWAVRLMGGRYGLSWAGTFFHFDPAHTQCTEGYMPKGSRKKRDGEEEEDGRGITHGFDGVWCLDLKAMEWEKVRACVGGNPGTLRGGWQTQAALMWFALEQRSQTRGPPSSARRSRRRAWPPAHAHPLAWSPTRSGPSCSGVSRVPGGRQACSTHRCNEPATHPSRPPDPPPLPHPGIFDREGAGDRLYSESFNELYQVWHWGSWLLRCQLTPAIAVTACCDPPSSSSSVPWPLSSTLRHGAGSRWRYGHLRKPRGSRAQRQASSGSSRIAMTAAVQHQMASYSSSSSRKQRHRPQSALS